MFRLRTLMVLLVAATYGHGQIPSFLPDPTRQQTYTLHRSSSRESTGANADARTVTPGQTITILDVGRSRHDLAYLVHAGRRRSLRSQADRTPHVLGWRDDAERRNTYRRLLWPGEWHLLSLGVTYALCWCG